jgi:hypothetical protein
MKPLLTSWFCPNDCDDLKPAQMVLKQEESGGEFLFIKIDGSWIIDHNDGTITLIHKWNPSAKTVQWYTWDTAERAKATGYLTFKILRSKFTLKDTIGQPWENGCCGILPAYKRIPAVRV